MTALWSTNFVLLINFPVLRSATPLDWNVYAEEVVNFITIRKSYLRKARNSVSLSDWKRFTQGRHLWSILSTKLKQCSLISDLLWMRYPLTNHWGSAVSDEKYQIPEKVGDRSGSHMSACRETFCKLSYSFPEFGFLLGLAMTHVTHECDSPLSEALIQQASDSIICLITD